MRDEQWLREGLADAVPEPPANPDRARGAERLARRRRRTTGLAVVGTAGAVGAAAVLTATLASGGGGKDDDKAATDPAAAVQCPPAEVEGGVIEEAAIDRPDPDAPEAVPEGATSARICAGPGVSQASAVPDQPVSDVAAMVDAVNGLERTGPPEICTSDFGPGYRIAFGYDDGTRFVVSLKLYGCNEVVVGSGYRADARTLWADVTELVNGELPTVR